MWSPTHVNVAVKRATNLLTKGNNGTNDCFVTIGLGKEKCRTSIKQNSPPNVEWNEECDLLIPEQGNKAEIVLTALHRSFLGVDEFLGQVRIPLANFDFYERARNRWYKLEAKKGKENKKDRGSLEVRIEFIVKAGSLTNLSKQEKHKSSLGGLSHLTQSVGGSLLSIGSLEKRKSGLKKLAKSFGSKVHITGKKKDKYGTNEDDSIAGSIGNISSKFGSENFLKVEKQHTNVDPGVISEDEDEFTFDDLSQISSTSSVCSPNLSSGIHSLKSTSDRLNSDPNPKQQQINESTEQISTPPPAVDEWEAKLYGKHGKSSTLPANDTSSNRSSFVESSPVLNKTLTSKETNVSLDTIPQMSPKTTKPEKLKEVEKSKDSEKPKDEKSGNKFSKKFKYFRKEVSELEPEITKHIGKMEKFDSKNFGERIIIGGENQMEHQESSIPNDVLQKYEGKSRLDLILMVTKLQATVDDNKRKQRDMEDYLDELLLRVMETTPKILQRPYKGLTSTK